MLRVVTALRKELDAPVELTLVAAVKHMSEMMGLSISGVDLPSQVEALIEASLPISR